MKGRSRHLVFFLLAFTTVTYIIIISSWQKRQRREPYEDCISEDDRVAGETLYRG